MHVRQITEALRLRVKRGRRSDAIAFWSLLVAVFASIASVVQAGLLASQVWTPYRTSLYVRQLEVSGDFYGAAHEQWAAIIDLNTQCERAENRWGDSVAFRGHTERFLKGATDLHDAYAATAAAFPEQLHAPARRIWMQNEFLVEKVVLASANCNELVSNYGANDAFNRAEAMHNDAIRLLDDMRLLTRVDRWSRTDIENERARRERMRAKEREREARATQEAASPGD